MVFLASALFFLMIHSNIWYTYPGVLDEVKKIRKDAQEIVDLQEGSTDKPAKIVVLTQRDTLEEFQVEKNGLFEYRVTKKRTP